MSRVSTAGLAWASKHAHRLPAEQVAKLRAGDSTIVLPCGDAQGGEWPLCIGSGIGRTWRGDAILEWLDTRPTQANDAADAMRERIRGRLFGVS